MISFIKKSLKTVLYLTLVAVFVFSVFESNKIFVKKAGASGALASLVGWAYSEGGQWVRFDPQLASGSCSGCGGVFIETTPGPNFGDITGYAWMNPVDETASPKVNNIGYLNMNPPGPYPSGPGTTNSASHLTGINFVGWARACSVFVNGCGGTMQDDDLKPNNERGGWDGWVSLDGTNYGVIKNGNDIKGFAWGGDVLGWIKFDPPFGGVKIDYNPPPPPANSDPKVDLRANGVDSLVVAPGQAVTLSWTSQLNGTTGVGCVLKKLGSPDISFSGVSGTYATGAVTNSTTYSIDCTYTVPLGSPQRNMASDQITLNPRPIKFEEF